MSQKISLVDRHTNMWGMVLRLVTYICFGVALWYRQPFVAMGLVVVDVLNWFCMPPSKTPSALIQKVVDAELRFLALKWNGAKTASVVLLFCSAILLFVSLWYHWGWGAFGAFVIFGVVKQIIVKLMGDVSQK